MNAWQELLYVMWMLIVLILLVVINVAVEKALLETEQTVRVCILINNVWHVCILSANKQTSLKCCSNKCVKLNYRLANFQLFKQKELCNDLILSHISEDQNVLHVNTVSPSAFQLWQLLLNFSHIYLVYSHSDTSCVLRPMLTASRYNYFLVFQ